MSPWVRQQKLRAEFAAYLATMAPWLKHFSADEVLTKCDRIGNSVPPKELWPNILPTLKVAQELRQHLGRPVKVHSVYRSKVYNAKIGGASQSQHMRFAAMDLSCPGVSPATVAQHLRQMRQNGRFKGGIGEYPGFVHVDTRGKNVNWG
jgi:uncharacterized protein YcbK (DUF882 family)